MPLSKRLLAEAIGTLWLVLGGCGSAVLAAAYPELGIGFLGVALAFGLTVVTMAYAIGAVSGAHLNPAVTIGFVVGGRFPAGEAIPYVIAQVIGAIGGAVLIWLIASGRPDFVAGGFASNGYGELSPGGYGLVAALICEIVMTALFVFVILGATSKKASPILAGLTIGLCLTLIHLISIPVTNTSVNPARSTGVALFADTGALGQLWLFWVAPIVGAVIGAIVWRIVGPDEDE